MFHWIEECYEMGLEIKLEKSKRCRNLSYLVLKESKDRHKTEIFFAILNIQKVTIHIV